MDVCYEASDYDDVLQVVDFKSLPKVLSEDEISVMDMTSLGTLMLLGQTTAKMPPKSDGPEMDYTDLHRLSLAYERMHSMPKMLLDELAPHVRILDLSYNEFEELDFLSEFKELTHLICDHNNITSKTTLPFLPKLELLWLNHCKISELYPWARRLHLSCPNLKYLSLMGNPAAPSYLNGGNFYEYLHYRYEDFFEKWLFIISLFPNLIHLDDKTVTAEQKIEARKMYHRPIMERLMSKTHQNLPAYLRIVSQKISQILAPPPQFVVTKRNVII